jgi:hypothetical protein
MFASGLTITEWPKKKNELTAAGGYNCDKASGLGETARGEIYGGRRGKERVVAREALRRMWLSVAELVVYDRDFYCGAVPLDAICITPANRLRTDRDPMGPRRQFV